MLFEYFRAGATSDFRPQITAPSERKVPAINGSVSNRRNVLPCSRIREEEGSLENSDRPDDKSVGNGDQAETEEDEEERMLREFEEYDEQVKHVQDFSLLSAFLFTCREAARSCRTVGRKKTGTYGF